MENIYTTLINNEHSDIQIKEKSMGLPLVVTILSIAALVAGIIALEGYLSMTLIVLGLTGVVIGLVMCFKAKGAEKYDFYYANTGEKLRKQQLCYHPDDAGAVRDCILSKNCSRIANVHKQFQSSHYLEVWGTKSGDFYVAQMLHYESYHFEPESEVAYLKNEPAACITKLIQSK